MSRLRPAMSAPRRPTKATSPPSAAIQAATLAPEPPPCMVTLAGVSLPRASASRAWATVSVIRSPMTTTRAILGPHLAVLIWADSPLRPLPLAHDFLRYRPAAAADQRTSRHPPPDRHRTRRRGPDCHRTVIKSQGIIRPGAGRSGRPPPVPPPPTRR